MPILAGLLSKSIILIGGLFGLSWAGETIASKVGRIVSYAFIAFCGFVAINPNKALSFIKIIPKKRYNVAKWLIMIAGAFVAIYQFTPSFLERLGLKESESSWWQFWK